MADQHVTMFRYEVPVDDQWHEYTLTGPIRHIASRRPGTVEFWALSDPAAAPEPRRFRAYGTGHDVPRHLTYRGTALDGPLVWHLFEEPA